jgi:hypothetical protein
MKKTESQRLSYTCNDDETIKYPEKKWKKIRYNYCRKHNCGIVSDGTDWDFRSRTKNLLDIKTVLDKLEVPFFLTHGALLGAYRENDFIRHDDDVDLDIFEEIFISKYDEICHELICNGFIVRGRGIKYKNKKGEKINLYRHKEKVNIRGIYVDHHYKEDRYRLTKVFQYLKKFHENPDSINFKGEIFMTPGPIEEFLEYCFGEKWMIPILKTKEEKKRAVGYGVRRALIE